jgi:hypothetical protein
MDFQEGDRVAPRSFLERDHPDLRSAAGTVLAPLNGKVQVRWDHADEPRAHTKSSLKLIDRAEHIAPLNGDQLEARIVAPTGEWVDLPGDSGWYDVTFASGLVRRQYGRTQLDAARIASQLRDRELRPAKKEGEAPPHDAVRRTVYLGASDPGPLPNEGG